MATIKEEREIATFRCSDTEKLVLIERDASCVVPWKVKHTDEDGDTLIEEHTIPGICVARSPFVRCFRTFAEAAQYAYDYLNGVREPNVAAKKCKECGYEG